jgi:DHA2 family multidrug resistance protein
MSAAYISRAQFDSDATFGLVVMSQMFIGFGMSFVFVPALSMALGAVKPEELASAAGLIAFTRTASMAFSAAITTTRWQDGMTINHALITDQLSNRTGVDLMGAAGISSVQAPWHLDQLVQDQAVMLATNDTYFMFAAIVAFGAILIWFAPRPRLKAPAPRAVGAS